MINQVINAYLKYDSIPRWHFAYPLLRTYINEDEHSEKCFKADTHSTLIIGATSTYLRLNRNYIIQSKLV